MNCHLCLSSAGDSPGFFKDNITCHMSADSRGVQCTVCIITCKFKFSEDDNIMSLIALFFNIFQKLKNFRVLKARRKMKKRNILTLSATKT